MSHARSIVKKTIRWFVIVVAALVGLTALALVFFSLSPGEKILKGILEDRLSASLGQPVIIGSLETNITSRLVLKDIRISGAPSDSGAAILTVHDLRVNYNIWPLLHKELTITDITIDSLDVNLRRDARGEYNLAILNDTTTSSNDTSSSSFTVSLGSVRLGYLSATYDDASLPAVVDIHDGRFELMLDSAGGHTFRLSLGPIDAVYDSISVLAAEFTADGSYTDAVIHIDSMRAQAERMRLEASGEVPLDSTGVVSGHLELAGRPDSLLRRISRRFDLPDVNLHDDFSLRADISGSAEALEVSATLDIPKTDVSGARLNRGVVAMQWHADSIRVDSLYLNGFGGTVYGTAEVILDTIPRAQAELALNDIDISSLWKYLYHEPSPYTGQLQGTMSIVGRGGDFAGWNVDAALRATRATYRSQPFPDFSTTIALSGGSGRIRIEQDDFTITANGKYYDGRIDGSYTVDIHRLEPLAEFFDFHELSGSVSASGGFDGTIENPSLDADVDATNLRFENFPVDSLTGSLTYKDSMLTINKLSFEGDIQAIDPQHPPFHIDSVAGGFSYRGKISGALDSLIGDASVAVTRARYREYAVDSAGVAAHVAGRDIFVDSAWAFRDSDYMKADGRFNIDQMAGSAALAMFDLSHMSTEDTTRQADSTSRAIRPTFGSLHATFDLSDTSSMRIKAVGEGIDIGRMTAMFSDSLNVGGMLSFRADLSGTTTAPEGSLDVVATKPHYDGYTLDSLTADVSIDTGVVLVNRFASYGPGRHMTAHGSINLSRDSTGAPVITRTSKTRGQIQADSIDLTAFDPFLAETASMRGRAGMRMTWNGTVEEPHVIGAVTLDRFTVITAEGIDSVYNVTLRGSLEDSTLTINSASGILLREPFTMHGDVTARQLKRFAANVDIVLKRLGTVALTGEFAADSIDLTARIDRLELGLLEPFVPDVDSLSGTLACRIDIRGTPEDFRLFGNVDISDLVVLPSMISTPVTGGVIKISFDKNLVTIDTVYARFGGGPVTISGTLTQDAGEITDVNLKLSADSVKVSQPKEFILAVERARLTYARQNDYYLLDGDVQLGDSRLTMNFPFQSILPWAQSVEQISTEYPPLLQKTRLNVRVRESQNLWVDNNLAKLRLHSELAVIGSAPQPNLSGQITVEEGYLLYLDRKFKISTGSAYFVDPNHFNPEIDFQAATTVTTYQALSSTAYTITIAAQGPLDDLLIDLTSDPVLDKADIVSLLTLGATREQLAGKNGSEEGGVQGVLTRRAEALTSNQVTGYVSGKIGSLLGLDQVSVQGNLFNLRGDNGPQITASKMLSKRIKLTYSTTVGHLNEESIQVGYQLSRRFFLEGQTDRAGSSSLDLKYRLLFR